MYKPIVHKEKDDSTTCYYYSNTVGKHGGFCIVEYSDEFENSEQHYLSIPKTLDSYTVEEIEEYVKFLCNAGYLIEFSIGNNEFVFTFEKSFYKTWNHFLAAYTALRYITYNYVKGFKKIPQYAIEIKNKLGDKVDELEALQLAHYKACDGNAYSLDGLHGLFKVASKLVNKVEYEDKKNLGVNRGFFKESVTFKWSDIHKKIKIDEEEVLNLLR